MQPRLLFVVARSRPDVYSQLEQIFGYKARVIFDRRRGDRRRQVIMVEYDRRVGDRRHKPSETWHVLGFTGAPIDRAPLQLH